MNDVGSLKLDAQLNESRTYLKNLIEAPETSDRVRKLCYKVLLLLGLVRQNIEDFICLYLQLSKSESKQVDLKDELTILRDNYINKSGDDSNTLKNPTFECHGKAKKEEEHGSYNLPGCDDMVGDYDGLITYCETE